MSKKCKPSSKKCDKLKTARQDTRSRSATTLLALADEVIE
jgi:hypothetical protein